MKLDQPDRADPDGIRSAVADYVLSWLEGDSRRMASCLHPALRKRAVVDPASSDLVLDESPFEEMTGPAVAEPKPFSREFETEVLSVTGRLASASVLSEPYLDLLHLARFGDRWLIVNALYEPRSRRVPAARDGIGAALTAYAESYPDGDPERARSCVHPDLAERRLKPEGSMDLEEWTFDDVIDVVTAGPEPATPQGYALDILASGDGIAAAFMAAAWWEFHLHLAWFGARWMIVNVLYRDREA